MRLVHQLWLRFSDLVSPDELHHHDVVHFALDEVLNELQEGKEEDVVARLKEHVNRNKAAKKTKTIQQVQCYSIQPGTLRRPNFRGAVRALGRLHWYCRQAIRAITGCRRGSGCGLRG